MPLLHKGRKETKLPLASTLARVPRALEESLCLPSCSPLAGCVLLEAGYTPPVAPPPPAGGWLAPIYPPQGTRKKIGKRKLPDRNVCGTRRNKNTSDLGKSFKAGPGYGGLLTRTKKTGRKLLEEKGRKGRKALLGGFGKRAARCPGDVCCGTPRNKNTQARAGLSSSGPSLIWALFLLRAAWLRFAYFHQSLFLF